MILDLKLQLAKKPIESLLSSQSQSSQESVNNESFQENVENKKRVRTTYTKFSSYDTHIEATGVITEEFDRERLTDTKEGQKERWNFKRYGCPKKCYILFTLNDETVSLWYNDLEHCHENSHLKPKFGMDQITKNEIDKLFRNGTKTPQQVLSGYESLDDFFRVMCWSHVHRNCTEKLNAYDKDIR